MPVNFQEVNATLTATATEVTEHETALANLEAARGNLTAAQDTVAAAQEAVTAATDAEGAEKADVVAGINTAIQQLTAILQTLQV